MQRPISTLRGINDGIFEKYLEEIFVENTHRSEVFLHATTEFTGGEELDDFSDEQKTILREKLQIFLIKTEKCE